jgi:F420-non-reducing hydrogenase iron-sulfur subunit
MGSPKIALFCCDNSGYPAFESVTEDELRDAVEVVRLPCSGKVEIGHILKAMEHGYAGVLVLGCPLDNCTSLRGSHRAALRVEAARKVLETVGIRPDLVEMGHVSSVDGYKVRDRLRQMIARTATATSAQGRSGT